MESPAGRRAVESPAGRPAVDMRTRVGDVALPNPVMTASGTSGHGAELGAYFDLSRLGAVVVKSLSFSPWAGNPAPRVHQAAAGMLNSVGLQNPGVGSWLEHDLPALAATGARIVASIWGFRAADYREAAAAIAAEVRRAGGSEASGAGRIVAVEANISCPNVEDRRNMFAHSCEGVAAAVGAAVEGLAGAVPLWVKLSPNVTDLPALARSAVEAGAGALVLTNTLMALALDPSTGRTKLGAGGGGLSGPALHPVAVRAVYECRVALPEVPIVGVGGVTSGEDAAEFLAAGADAVQVGTATFADPRAPLVVLRQLQAWCSAQGITELSEVVGRSHRSASPAGESYAAPAEGSQIPSRLSTLRARKWP